MFTGGLITLTFAIGNQSVKLAESVLPAAVSALQLEGALSVGGLETGGALDLATKDRGAAHLRVVRSGGNASAPFCENST